MKKSSLSQSSQKVCNVRVFYSVILTFLTTFTNAWAAPALTSGDVVYTYAWIRGAGDSLNKGHYGQSTIGEETSHSGGTTISADLDIDNNIVSWLTDPRINIRISSSKPASVISHSPTYENCRWLESVAIQTNTQTRTVKFPFPILNPSASYGKYTRFTVTFADSMEAVFFADEDSLFVCNFINRNSNDHSQWHNPYAIRVLTTSSNLLRIHSIECNGEYRDHLSTYLGIDLTEMSSDAAYYGLDILDSTGMAPPIEVMSVENSCGASALQDSTYTLSWRLGMNADRVEACSVYVSLDSGYTWVPEARTDSHTNQITWTAPQTQAEYCTFNVRALGDEGQKAEARSGFFSIISGEENSDTVAPVNDFELNALPDTSTIRLSWSREDNTATDVRQIKILMCDFRYPTGVSDSHSIPVGTFGISDSFVVISDLERDQTYFFALFAGDYSDNWSNATSRNRTTSRLTQTNPSLSSSTIVHIAGTDTQHLYTDTLSLWSDDGLSFTDTLDRWLGPQEGFIAASPAFLFRSADSGTALRAKISWYDQAVESASKIRLYQYDLTSARWFLETAEPLIDTIDKKATVSIQRLDRPFILMIDTAAPRVDLTSTPQPSDGCSISADTLIVHDNVSNFSVKMLAGPGDMALVEYPGSSVRREDLDNGTTRIITDIAPDALDPCSGMRAQVVVSDGIFWDTTILSKPVERSEINCDNRVTSPLQWTPLGVTAQPHQSSLVSVLINSFGGNGNYDKELMRIIRWLPDANDTFGGGWVEYGNAADSVFNFAPGYLLWIKTKEETEIDLGSAVVPALRDSFQLILSPENWTDFYLPYSFDIYIGDILEATREVNGRFSADSLEIYSWSKTQDNYFTDPRYLPEMPGLSRVLDTLRGSQGYAIFNPCEDTVFLRIPPTSVSTSKFSIMHAAAKRLSSAKNGWSIRIDAATDKNDRLAPVYCGYSPALVKSAQYVSSPSFANASMRIHDRKTGQNWGHVVASQHESEGVSFEILFENSSSEATTIHASVSRIAGLNEGFSVKWFTPDGDARMEGQDTIGVSLGGGEKKYRILAAGSAQYLQKMYDKVLAAKLALRKISPNPFRTAFKIMYSLPYSDLQKVSFSLYNLQGKRVWRKDIRADLQPGHSTININRQFSAGAYILQMETAFEGSSKRSTLKRLVTCVK